MQFQRYNRAAIATFGAYWELKLLFDVVRSTLRRCCKCDVATSTLWQRCQYNIHGLFGHELTIQRQGNVEATLQFWRRGISVATMCSVCTTLRPNHKHCHSVFRWWVSYFSLKYNWRNAFFFAIWVFIHKHSQITGLQGKWGGHFFNSSLPLPPASQTLKH